MDYAKVAAYLSYIAEGMKRTALGGDTKPQLEEAVQKRGRNNLAMAKNKRDNSKPEEELKAEDIQTEGEDKVEKEEAAKQPKRDYEAELAAEKDRYLRLYAEYDNYRRRSQKEREVPLR